MTKAFGYLRVSGKGQLDGDGFPRQRAAIRKYAAEHDIKIVEWFEEQGVSGTKDQDERPAFQRLLLALHGDGVRMVVIEKLDRLARDLMVQESIIGDLRKHGFELVSVMEPDLCSDDPSRTMVRQFFGAVSQYEKSTIVSKLRGARQRARARDGRCEGRKPYGTRPGEQPVVARMCELHRQGHGYSGVAGELNKAGISTRYGCQWTAQTVRRVLLRAPGV